MLANPLKVYACFWCSTSGVMSGSLKFVSIAPCSSYTRPIIECFETNWNRNLADFVLPKSFTYFWYVFRGLTRENHTHKQHFYNLTNDSGFRTVAPSSVHATQSVTRHNCALIKLFGINNFCTNRLFTEHIYDRCCF